MEAGTILTLQMEIQALPYQMSSKLDQLKENYCKFFKKGLKGQIISEQICGVLKFSKKATNIARISALASKLGQIKKMKAIFYINL